MHIESPLPVLIAATAAVLLTMPMLTSRGQDPATKPTPASIQPAPRTDKWAVEREKELLRRAKEEPKAKVVFVGDSITQGWEGEGADYWKQHFAPLGALNLGNSGDRTEHVLWRLHEAPLTRLSPEHVVLMIGTNNLGHGSSNAEETLLGVKAVVETMHAQCPEAAIHVLEIFPRGDRINAMRGDIDQVNQALRAFVRDHERKAKPGHAPRLSIHAIGDLFVQADGTIDKAIMPDFLHLSKDGYRIWGEALLPLVSK